MEKHLKSLESLCSICTKKLGRVSYSNRSHAGKGNTITLLESCFGSTIGDNPAIFPPRFCNSCYLTMKRMSKAQQDDTVYRKSLALHSWVEHVHRDCTTCDLVEARKTGGRPKTKNNIKGCYLSDVCSVAGPRRRCDVPLTTSRVLTISGGVNIGDLVCKLCVSMNICCAHHQLFIFMSPLPPEPPIGDIQFPTSPSSG